MKNPLVAISLILALGVAARGEPEVCAVSWDALQQAGTLLAGDVLPADDQTSFARLKIDNRTDDPVSITVLTLLAPDITAPCYVLKGRLCYDHVAEGESEPGYLEMLSYFGDGAPSFSRTLSPTGPGQMLRGSCDWRFFGLPFSTSDDPRPPRRLDLNVVLPGRGTVLLGPLQLVQGTDVMSLMTPAGAWWSDQDVGLFGGLAGALLGLLGALIGVLVSRARARTVVLTLLSILVATGVAGLIAGVIAVSGGQPYGVYYPLLLIGGLCALLPVVLLRATIRRYTEVELRKMSAQDA